ncbi:TadE family protein [Streptomyces sp. NPDC005141]
MRVAWWPGSRRGDDGSVAIEAAIVLPSLIMFLCLAIAGGRIVTSSAKVDAADGITVLNDSRHPERLHARGRGRCGTRWSPSARSPVSDIPSARTLHLRVPAACWGGHVATRCARDLALGPAGCAELRSWVRPFSIALVKVLFAVDGRQSRRREQTGRHDPT